MNQTNEPSVLETVLTEEEQKLSSWLQNINTVADEKAKELSALLGCEVSPAVYVVEEGVNAAIAHIKQPDAKQALKLMRSLGENYENGLELGARSQLIRTSDLALKQIEGEASDARFMDVNGQYDLKNTALNLALLLKIGKITTILQDQFKKK